MVKVPFFGRKKRNCFGTIPQETVIIPAIEKQRIPSAENISLVDQKYLFGFTNISHSKCKR